MSNIYKTAKGKTVDIDKIKLSNENVMAVGNMKVNARGDLLDNNGKVAVARNQIMDKIYTVDPAPYSPNDPASFSEVNMINQNNKAKELHDLANNLVKPSDLSALEPSATTTAEPAVRGSLAASVAKPVTVTQQPLPNPKKSSGPSRI